MKKNTELKTILTLGFPLLAGRLSHYFHNVTDSMMLGHYREGSSELAIGVLAFCFFFFIPETMARAFSNQPETLATIAKALHFFSIFYLIEIIGFSFELIFSNNGWAKFVLASKMVTNWVFIIGFSFLMNLLFPGNYYLVWLGFGIYQVFHSIALHGGYLSKRWLKVKVET